LEPTNFRVTYLARGRGLKFINFKQKTNIL
jgi:hypothetical protein